MCHERTLTTATAENLIGGNYGFEALDFTGWTLSGSQPKFIDKQHVMYGAASAHMTSNAREPSTEPAPYSESTYHSCSGCDRFASRGADSSSRSVGVVACPVRLAARSR
jgi:hypothetical protein